MSGKNNVNPDHYKVAGRNRPNETVIHERQKQAMAQERERLERRRKVQPRPADARRRGGPPGEGQE
jgi:hypothetical protein